MIKRLIGIIVTVVVVVIIFAVMRCGEYRSMLSADGQASVVIKMPVKVLAAPPIGAARQDTLACDGAIPDAELPDVLPADTLR